MSMILRENITGPSAWCGVDLVNDKSWIHELSDQAKDSIDKALLELKKRGLSFPDFHRNDFPIPAFCIWTRF